MSKRKLWKRSRRTNALVYQIRSIIRDAGYDEELAIVPLSNVISVLVRRQETIFNLRLDKNSLSIVDTKQLTYQFKRENIFKISRH